MPWPQNRRLLGTKIQRLDGPEKATGRARYSYDINGNLVSVTDRAGDPPVTYVYGDTNHAHYLTGINDPLGVQQLNVQYDQASGRMIHATDPVHTVNFGYTASTTTAQETISDSTVGTATINFTNRGTPSQVIDPTGAQSTFGYTDPHPAAAED